MDLEYLRASDGVGPASYATVTVSRLAAATTLQVNAVTNWPTKFIATYGLYNATTERLEVSSIRVFKGRLDGANIIIDEFVSGFTDGGNDIGDRVYIKPASEFADLLADLLAVSHEVNGAIKTTVTDAIKSDVLTAAGTMTNKRIKPRTYSVASTGTLAPDLATYNIYTVTALAAAMTISAPAGTPSDGEVIVIRIKDNGTTRAITWNAAFTGIGDTLLAATTAGKWHYLNGMYNTATSKWDMLPPITQA